jgi:hypothetical protein
MMNLAYFNRGSTSVGVNPLNQVIQCDFKLLFNYRPQNYTFHFTFHYHLVKIFHFMHLYSNPMACRGVFLNIMSSPMIRFLRDVVSIHKTVEKGCFQTNRQGCIKIKNTTIIDK